jgi:hypothetical protein
VDRLTGVCRARESHFLVRVREKLGAPVLEKLPDGSAWVEVRVGDPEQPRRAAGAPPAFLRAQGASASQKMAPHVHPVLHHLTRSL